MKQTHFSLALLCGAALFLTPSCSPKTYRPDAAQKTAAAPAPAAGNTVLDTFADLQILRYDLPGFDQLGLRQKTFIYYLSEATLAGRDIIYDQHCKYNLAVRKTLEGIFESYKGDRASADWKAFQTYAKRVWFSNGIHHHYNETKIVPGFSRNYFVALVQNSDPKKLPLLAGEDANALIVKLTPVLFDPGFMAKRTNKDKTVDVVKTSAVNFYDGVTAAQVDAYYQKMLNAAGSNPPSFGLNSKLVADKSGKLTEQVWKAGAGNMYGAAISKIAENLEKAIPFAENEQQKKAIRLLVEYYKSGDLRKFDEFNMVWVKDTESLVERHRKRRRLYQRIYRSVSRSQRLQGRLGSHRAVQRPRRYEKNGDRQQKRPVLRRQQHHSGRL